MNARWLAIAVAGSVLLGCDRGPPAQPAREAPSAAARAEPLPDRVGTREPFAAHAIYFVVTDRFVNGDPSNDHRDQGVAAGFPSFDIPIDCGDGRYANLGYLGGDFRGLLDHADYIREMGFGAVWITPIVDNPDQAFSGGDEVRCDSILTDRGKSGYHGYWGMNFWREDEHLVSADLDFAAFAAAMRERGLNVMLDVVLNHASPGWTMPEKQPGFGQVFDRDGRLLADHGNLPPEQLDHDNEPLHRWFNTERDLAQLADFNHDHPEVVEYLIGAKLHWIEQGADAFRVDTLKHVPKAFWPLFSARIRERHPGFFMLGEVYDFDPEVVAAYTQPEHGGFAVFDFPMRQAMVEVFQNGAGFETLLAALALDGPYHDPYTLGIFYDNHDMARLDGPDQNFINAHHWLFTARGIPVVYYGSEVGFMRGRSEHNGNRNYFGAERIAKARAHPIHQALTRIANLRRALPALQRGLMQPLHFDGDHAAFLRVLRLAGEAQSVLVLLNKGDADWAAPASAWMEAHAWRDAETDQAVDAATPVQVPAHGFRLLKTAALVGDWR